MTKNSIFEDGYEFLDNAGFFEPDVDTATNDQLLEIVTSEVSELRHAMGANDAIETLDGGIDIIVATTTLLLRLGFTVAELEAAWDEIQHSNMTKTIDPTIVNGKLQKGDYYVAPRLDRVYFN